MNISTPVLKRLLNKRVKLGKEDPERLDERMGTPSIKRPSGKLVWFHAASVGEAQSTLILIDKLSSINPQANFLITTGTVTSAELMSKRLPNQCFHQYIPLDHPKWTKSFIEHFKPDVVFWLESELWPNMLGHIKTKNIPCVLVNARLSERSLKRWQKSKKSAARLLSSFDLILCQTEEDATSYRVLGAENILITDNIKYSAAPLPFEKQALSKIEEAVTKRPLWLYASTHEGEERIAASIHKSLKAQIPELLTIIVPRHPERGKSIEAELIKLDLKVIRRGSQFNLPSTQDDIYIADTLGELGLFYRLSPIACIGRSFSNDGGGGHNPIEAAQLDTAILHGPHIQNLKAIYDEIDSYGAALCAGTPEKLEEYIYKLIKDEETLHALQNKASEFSVNKSRILERVVKYIEPILEQAEFFPSIEKEKECA
jgi:3-deoxy-D-manno-octulosonic-acid transferase